MQTSTHKAIDRLRPLILDHIPLARAMQMEIARLDDDHVVLSAPLAPNMNDKGCGFGGSIGALLTLAGWSLLTARMQREDLPCDIFIQDSSLNYLKPAWQALDAHARIDATELDGFAAQLRSRGRARIEVHSELYSGEVKAATMQARYVAIASSKPEKPL